jgi:hypothetical protein
MRTTNPARREALICETRIQQDEKHWSNQNEKLIPTKSETRENHEIHQDQKH